MDTTGRLQRLLGDLRGESTGIDEVNWQPAFEPPDYKRLVAKIGSFHDMLKSHRADLKKAEDMMKRLEPVMKATNKGNGADIPDMMALMDAVNKDLNECHLYLSGAADQLHKAVAVELPSWK